ALILRVLPGFEPDMPAEQRIEMPRHVAGGEDRGIAAAAEFVDDDAVARLDAGRLGELDIGLCADADRRIIGDHWRTAFEEDAQLLAGVLDRRDLDAGLKIDPFGAM